MRLKLIVYEKDRKPEKKPQDCFMDLVVAFPKTDPTCWLSPTKRALKLEEALTSLKKTYLNNQSKDLLSFSHYLHLK